MQKTNGKASAYVILIYPICYHEYILTFPAVQK